MSQFPGAFQDQYAEQPFGEPRRTSGLAITALVLSLVGVIPCCGFITAPLGTLLGLIAFFKIRSNPLRKGTGLALAAVVIGVLFIILYALGGVWGYNTLVKPLEEGPREGIQAGFAGNIARFKSTLFGPASTASDAEAQVFIDELRHRYGDFRGSFPDEAALRANPPSLDDLMKPVKTYPYSLQFVNKTVSATVEYTPTDPQTGQFFWGIRFGTIVVHDPDLGDLVYPPGANQSSGGSTTVPATRPSRPRRQP